MEKEKNMSAPEVKKRLYVGGLSKDVSENELKQRFELFLTVSSIRVKSQTDSEGNHTKTFAHLDVQGTEAGLKKCYNAYQNAKWRGSVMKLEDAKESFLDRLAAERQEEQTKPKDHGKSKKKKVEEWKPPEIDKLSVVPVPGTPIPGKKDWVVGKYGRVLPVLNVKKSHVTKAVKHDPSKFCHASKVFKEDDTDMSKVNCDTLTWEIDEPDSDITKKRKGEFPPDPKPKKTKPFPVELLKPPVKENFSIRPFAKENSSNKSSFKKDFSKKHERNENVDNVNDDNGENLDVRVTTEDGLEIVKVGGSMHKKNNPIIRSRFDSDYESDGDDNGTESSNVKNNETKSPSVKSPKKTDSITQACAISHKKGSSAKKSKLVVSSDGEESDGAKEILEFKGIGSLITKPVDISPNNNNSMKKKASVHTEKTVCNGKMNTDSDASDVEKNNNKVVASLKKKGKRKSQGDSEIFSLKNVKKPVNEEKWSLKPSPISAIQKDSSQYADLFLSEFVAQAPKSQQTRQKHDPYDSDLDSNNFELVARKLAKKAGVEMARENKKNARKGDLNTSVNSYSKKRVFGGSKTDMDKSPRISNIMFSLAGGYSADRDTQSSGAGSQQDKGDNIKNPRAPEQIPQKEDLTRVAPKNVNLSSSKRTTFDSDDEDTTTCGNGELKGKSKIAGKTTPSKDKKDAPKEAVDSSSSSSSSDDDEDSSDESEVKNSKDENGAKDKVGKGTDDDDVTDDSSDEEEVGKGKDKVKNAKDKIVAEESSEEEDEDSSDEEDVGKDKVRNAKDKNVEEDEDSSDEEEVGKVKDKVKNAKDRNVAEESSEEEDEDSSDEEDVGKDKVKNAKENNVAKESSEEEDEDSSNEEDVGKDKVKNAKEKNVAKESSEDEDSSDEEDVEKSNDKDKVKNAKDKDVAKESSEEEDEDSSDDEDDVENNKNKDESEDSSASDEDEIETSQKDGVCKASDVKGKSEAGIKAVPSKDKKDKASSKHEVFDSSSSSSDEEEGKDDGEEALEVSLAEEKKRNLQVLENVVGKNKVDKLTAKLKRDNVHIMDMNQLRFDPTKIKSQQTSQKEPKKKKIKLSPEKPAKNEEDINMERQAPKDMPAKDKIPNPEKKQKKESVEESSTVKSEVTMSDSLVTMLKTEAKLGGDVEEKGGESSSFSLLDMFDGRKEENNEEEAMETDFQPPVKPLSGLSLPKLGDKKDNVANNKAVSKDKGSNDSETANTKQKDSKDKSKTKDALTNKDVAQKQNLMKNQAAFTKVLKNSGKIDVRFSKAEWDKRNSQIRQDMLKICKSRSNYAVRKKRIEGEREKEKSVRKFGSWKKK